MVELKKSGRESTNVNSARFANISQSEKKKKNKRSKSTTTKKSSYKDIVLKYSKAYHKKEIQLYRELRLPEGKKRQLI